MSATAQQLAREPIETRSAKRAERRRKVLVISAAFPPLRGGESDHMLHLATRLAERDLDVEVLTVQGAIESDKLPFKVHAIMPRWCWRELPIFLSFLRRCAPDGILLKYSGWLYNNHPMITFAPTLAKLIVPRSPFITQFGFAEGAYPDYGSAASRALTQLTTMIAGRKDCDKNFGTLLRDSDHLIALGEQYASRLIGLYPPAAEKLEVLPPPPIMHMFTGRREDARRLGRQMLDLNDDDFVVAFFGVIYRGKGVETLLRAFEIFSRKHKNAKLALIGGQSSVMDGASYFDDICALARELGIASRMVAKEYEWDSPDGSLYLCAADVCALPFEEGVTLIRSSVAGAAAHGLPIITTRGEALETPFVDGKNMLLCRPKDPDELALAIERVAADADLRSKLGEGAVTLAREWFSWDKAIDHTVAALAGEAVPA
jgi:glycosyltransferase involved in cell wall biosynthesis